MKLTAIPRITLGLVSLGAGLLLAFDLLLHLFPSQAETTRSLRSQLGNNLAIQVAALVQAQDLRTVDRTLSAMQSHDPGILSIGLRRADGALLAQAGDHLRHWAMPDVGKASPNAMVVGLQSEQRRWGTLEISFRPLHQQGLFDWLFSGPSKLLVLFSVSATALFFVYLRRMLQHLDPSAAVPDRVRSAFDALTEGVVIVDPQGRILLANQRFQALGPASAKAELVGRALSELDWLTPAQGEGNVDVTPWRTTMRTRQPVHGTPFLIRGEGDAQAKVVINCSPLLDEGQGVRGCLLTIDDVTALERSHEQLLEALADLAASKQQLEYQNNELETLASVDPLSNCLNRRAFFAGLEGLFQQASQQRRELVCIMADIDHFKNVNDLFGHAIGDEAIQCFAEVLRSSARHGDLVGRYGGEEFCVVCPGLSLEAALQLAELMRKRFAATRHVGNVAGHQVTLTASFGVTSLRLGAGNEVQFIDQADRAMYIAKQTGRNRVIGFDPQLHAVHNLAEAAAS